MNVPDGATVESVILELSKRIDQLDSETADFRDVLDRHLLLIEQASRNIGLLSDAVNRIAIAIGGKK